MARAIYKTKMGTELPIMNLRGKEYLEVKFRVVWFREERPLWGIETEIVSSTDTSACARALIRDETGKIIASSHKTENSKGFPDFIEKAETGAIGRALALCGYGTQFCADEMDEADRVVDSPVQKAPEKKAERTPGGLTEKQIGRMFSLARDAEWSNDELKTVMVGAFDIASSKELNRDQYDSLCKCLEEKKDPTSTVAALKKKLAA